MNRFDAIVIGSGFAGAFAADRLIDGGLRVALVERGPWRDTEPVRAAGITAERSPLPQGRHAFTGFLRNISAPMLPRNGLTLNPRGVFDMHLQRDMTALSSSGVGGASHIYAAMNTPTAVDRYWENRAEGIDDAVMQARVKDAIARMGARPPRAEDNIPNFIGARLKDDPQLTADVEQPPMGYRFDRGVYRDNSFFGTADGSKVTLDALLIAPAMQRGLTVLDLHEAVDFGRDDVGGWRVTLHNHHDNSYRHIAAPRLLLAAGTLSTLRLLFGARDRGALGAMNALGLGVGANGDLIGYWARNEAGADFTRSTPCHGRFALRGQKDCPNLTAYGFNGIDRVPLPRRVRARIKRDLMLVGMGPDEANGFATWRRGRLIFRYNSDANPVTARVQDAFSEIERRTGTRIYRLPARYVMTAHVLGGARVDDNPARGVIDGHGEAHDLPGLFVLDAAALPAASGGPPSMTIAGWATHVADGIAARG